MIIIEKQFDAITSEEVVIERPATEAEIAEREAFDAEMTKLEVENAAKEAEKAALFTKLGITEDEAKLLLS